MIKEKRGTSGKKKKAKCQRIREREREEKKNRWMVEYSGRKKSKG